MKYILLYLFNFVLYAILDILWVQVFAKGFIKRQVGSYLADQANLTAGLLFYGVFAMGLLVFVTLPALQADSWPKALGLGALYGLVTYGTYELVNKALLKDWPTQLVLVDLLYGVVACAITSWLVFQIGRRFFW
jgi:uncharacterized membrane protein